MRLCVLHRVGTEVGQRCGVAALRLACNLTRFNPNSSDMRFMSIRLRPPNHTHSPSLNALAQCKFSKISITDTRPSDWTAPLGHDELLPKSAINTT